MLTNQNEQEMVSLKLQGHLCELGEGLKGLLSAMLRRQVAQ
jgi:hypothetical protein